MKVAFVSFGYPDKGHIGKFAFSHEEMLAYKNAGIDVEVFDFTADPNLFTTITTEEFQGITVHRFPIIKLPKILKPLYRLFVQKSKISNIIKNSDYDLSIFSFVNINFLMFINLFKKKSKKTVIIAHGVDAMALWESKFIFSIKKRLLKKADYIWARSDFTAALLKTILSLVDYNKINIVYNGINRKKFANVVNIRQTTLRKELNLPNKPILLSIGNLIPRKGIDITIEADRILKEKGFDFLHIIIGRGDEKEKLVDMIDKYGLKDNVLFISYVEKNEDLAKYYAVCDIYTMVSKTIYSPYVAAEGFGIVYAEAGYLGKPVIGGNSGGVPSVVKHGFTGFLVDPNTSDVELQVAYYTEKLLTDNNLYNEIAKNTRQFISDSFDWDKNAEIAINIMLENKN